MTTRQTEANRIRNVLFRIAMPLTEIMENVIPVIISETTPDRKPFRLTTLFRCGIIEDEKRVSSVDG